MVHRKLRVLTIFFALMVISSLIPFGYSLDAPALEWEMMLGGALIEWGHSMQVTGDGGYIITGSTTSTDTGWADVYLVKTDSGGNLMWETTFGGSVIDEGSSVQVTGDGGYIIAGSTYSFGAGGVDVYLVKTDSGGNMEWNKTYGGIYPDYGASVQVTGDGGYIVVGRTDTGVGDYDVYLVKTDSSGNMMWNRTFGGNYTEYGYSVQVTAAGGYIIAGSTTSMGAGATDVYFVKTDFLGNLIWETTFGGGANDEGKSVQITSDGGYVIAGSTYSFGAGWDDVYLVRTDSDGNLIWETTFGGIGFDIGESVQVTGDGGYVIAGWTLSSGAGGADVYLVKTDSGGNLMWETTIGGTDYDIGYSVQVTGAGDYIVAGYTTSSGAAQADFYLVKTSSLTPQWEITPRKNVFYTGDTVSFDISHSMGMFTPVQGSIVVVKNAQEQFVWLGDPMVNWLPVGDTYMVPTSHQTAMTNPLVIMQDSRGGIWTYDWIDADDNVIESGQFRVITSRVKNVGRFLARIYDLLDFILDLLNNLVI